MEIKDPRLLQLFANLNASTGGNPILGNSLTGKAAAGIALDAAKAHPFKTAGLIGSAAGNIGGLTDNDKFGGQLGGLALGGLGSYLAGDALGPYGKLMLTMGGGNLGALFDKLRARKEMEQAQGIPNTMLGR